MKLKWALNELKKIQDEPLQLNGTIDFYSLEEADSKLDDIENALASLGATWTLSSVQFEEDTNLIHTSWDWSVS